MAALAHEIRVALGVYGPQIDRYFFGNVFGIEMDVDLVIVHTMQKSDIEPIKQIISDIFRGYFIDTVSVSLMSAQEREQRYRLADKFVLMILRHKQLF